jgi:hypothetical protein
MREGLHLRIAEIPKLEIAKKIFAFAFSQVG